MKGYVAKIVIALAMIAGMTTAGAVVYCPQVRVFCPDDATEGTMLSFRASVTGGNPNVVPTYNWTVSSGSIMSGQGTSTIQVDTTGLGNRTVTATVDVGGFDRICATTSSCSTPPTLKVTATKVGEYPDPSEKASDPRLDGFARELEMDPSAQAYIIAYGGRVAREGEAQKALAAAKGYLVSNAE